MLSRCIALLQRLGGVERPAVLDLFDSVAESQLAFHAAARNVGCRQEQVTAAPELRDHLRALDAADAGRELPPVRP